MHKIILGTAQFGLNYGINNLKGQISEAEAFKILDYARSAAIQTLDTAMHYGNALEVIGNYHAQRNHHFDVISKFQEKPNFSLVGHIQQTLERLRIASLEGLLCHSFDFYSQNNLLIEGLISLKKEGIIKKMGVSIYNEKQLHFLIEGTIPVDIIQLPYNLLDNYAIKGHLIHKATQKGIEIHTRSAFLQGLFFKSTTSLPSKIQPLKPYLEILQTISNQSKIPMHQLALNYALTNEDIHKVVIGIDSLEQLKYNLSAVKPSLFSKNLINTLHQIKVEEQALLQPVNW